MVKITFLGDISLNNKFEKIASLNINPFEDVKSVLYDSDIVIGNLECLLYGKGVNILKKPRLGTTTKAYSLLKSIRINIATLAHNHYYDNLEEGFINSVNFLDENQILHLGAGLDREKTKKPVLISKKGLKFCFLNYLTLDTNPNIPSNAKVYANIYNKEKIINDIQNWRTESDFIILLLHWGGCSEGFFLPDWYQKKDAENFIDVGADLVIGGHSHTLQPFEVYKNKYIFYSLGNFCFDDVISDDIVYKWSEKSKKGVILTIDFEKGKNYKVDLVPIINQDCIVSKDNEVLYKIRIRNILYALFSKNIFLWKFIIFIERKIIKGMIMVFSKDGLKRMIKRLKFGLVLYL